MVSGKESPLFSSSAISNLFWVHGALGTLGGVGVKPQDGFVTHGTHAADLKPLKQAPDDKQKKKKKKAMVV